MVMIHYSSLGGDLAIPNSPNVLVSPLFPALRKYTLGKRFYQHMRLVIFNVVFSRKPRLYKRVCPSVGPLVRRSVGPSVRNLFFGGQKRRR